LLSAVSPKIKGLLSPSVSFIIHPSIPDEKLGKRPNPAYPGHDKNGFRNKYIPAKANIVTLGNSQTYGTGVPSQKTWPRQLENMTGLQVYNMAFASYGPVHSLLLFEEAETLNPDIIIEAFYFGNDLYDSFNIVYIKDKIPRLRATDPGTLEAIAIAENKETIKERVTKMCRFGGALKKPLEPLPPFSYTVKDYIANNSKVYGILRWVKRTLFTKNEYLIKDRNWDDLKIFAKKRKRYCQIAEKGPFKTLFTSEYRLSALDINDPRISEGLRISLQTFKIMNLLAQKQNREFIVLMIPTKELAFEGIVDHSSENYELLLKNENKIRNIIMDFMKYNGIHYIDALPALRDQFAKGHQPYHLSVDGHPNKYGHTAIADLVYKELEK